MRLTADWECTTSNKGNPFDTTNKAVCLGVKREEDETDVLFEFSDVQSLLSETTLLIGFNLKFDLHWFRRMGYVYEGRLWDCQLAEFILRNQSCPYPSLNDCAETYGLPTKLDAVKELWDQGIDTDVIEPKLLADYCKYDVDLTFAVYKNQIELFKTTHKHKYRLFLLSMMDTAVLEEMEFNGMCWDEGLSSSNSLKCEERINELRKEILGEYEALPINLNSGDHLSAILYGGTITHEYRVPVGVYKTGEKTGLPRYKVMRQEYQFKQQFKPIPKSELKKKGYYSTDEATLKQLKGTKENRLVLLQLDEFAKLEKLKGTYYDGHNKLISSMHWPKGMIYGQFNQVVARTGRLSSSKPNLQNASPEAKLLFYSRYPKE